MERSAYPDVYFTPGYGQAARDGEFDSWCSIRRFDGRWQVPLVIRRTAGGAHDAASPYGYSGVYASTDLTAVQVAEAWESTIGELRGRGLVSVFLRHSPLVPQASAHPDQLPLMADHPTVSIRIQDPDLMWSALEGRCRTSIRKAIGAGITARVRVAGYDDVRAGSPFRALYEQTMRRRTASDFYFFGDDYFQRLLEALRADLHVAEAVDAEGRVVAACLLMAHGPLLHYHLSGSDPQGARSGANNLVLWEACRFAAALGIEVFHLGGGLRPDDSLYRFKRSFGGTRGTYRTTGLILDVKRYEEMSGPGRSADGFFPAYRESGGRPGAAR
jgi:hypothetical protein